MHHNKYTKFTKREGLGPIKLVSPATFFEVPVPGQDNEGTCI